MALTKDSREFIESLISNEVEFLLIGALAVSWHGFPRFSADIDFFIRPTPDNAIRILSALNDFGFGSLGLSVEDFSAGRVIQLGVEPNRIDIMTSISGLSFEEAWKTRVTARIDGIEVPLIGRSALIQNKRASGRIKDLLDAEELARGEPQAEG
jgi:hypothetical protein